MSTTDIRNESHQLLDQIDNRFLAAVHALLRTYKQQAEAEKEEDPIVSYDVVTGTPRTASELTAILDKEVEAAHRGEYITLEDLRKESDQWLASIK